MTAETLEFDLDLDEPDDPAALARRAAEKLGVSVDALPPVRLLKRSLDARHGKVSLHFTLSVGEREPAAAELGLPHPRQVSGGPRVLIVGDGPAGLFAAYGLARRGIGAIVIDRGKKVQPRRRDLKLLNARGGVDPESNYCFGEGGAGTYSDGKLYTRSHKRGPVRDVIEVLALHGAPPAILTEARPHIGSNLLPQIITAMRERLESVGVEFRFGQRLAGLLSEGSGERRRALGAVVEDTETGASSEIAAQAVVLATGHSARDVYILCEEAGVLLEQKAFALGVRMEHPQGLIDQIQYGRHAGHPKLGAASYRLVQQVDGRGVFSFCMCPGGWIVPAMTDPAHLVVNGMSLSKRDSPYANSGLVVSVEPADYGRAGLEGPLAGIELQQRAERMACSLGGGSNVAPATRVSDFLAAKASTDCPATSYLPGIRGSDVAAALDATGLLLAARLRAALRGFSGRMRGLDSREGVLVGIESRTSSPVRIVRDPENLQSPTLRGLYPAGEGAGYAGGIVSAAVDGLRLAEQISLEIAHQAATR